MKTNKYLSILAVLALAACSKAPVAPEDPVTEPTVEVEDESVPVPIELGAGTRSAVTKADKLDNTNWVSKSFGLLAVEVNAEGDDDVLLDGVKVTNGAKPEGKTYYTATLDGGPYYYPLISKHNYSFYGYRTNEDDAYTYSEGYVVNDIALGYSDIIWDKCEATTFNGVNGYNAKYIRALKAVDGENYLDNENAPRLNFSHLTSAFVFNVVAKDAAAETSLDGKVTLKGITLENAKTTASLSILDGALTVSGDPANLDVKAADGEAPAAMAFEYPATAEEVHLFGAPLFVAPTQLYDPYADEGDGYSVVLSLNVTGQDDAMELDPIKLTKPAAGFEAGKLYKFTITINSLEEIVITTTITDWTEVDAGEITIE